MSLPQSTSISQERAAEGDTKPISPWDTEAQNSKDLPVQTKAKKPASKKTL